MLFACCVSWSSSGLPSTRESFQCPGAVPRGHRGASSLSPRPSFPFWQPALVSRTSYVCLRSICCARGKEKGGRASTLPRLTDIEDLPKDVADVWRQICLTPPPQPQTRNKDTRSCGTVQLAHIQVLRCHCAYAVSQVEVTLLDVDVDVERAADQFGCVMGYGAMEVGRPAPSHPRGGVHRVPQVPSWRPLLSWALLPLFLSLSLCGADGRTYAFFVGLCISLPLSLVLENAVYILVRFAELPNCFFSFLVREGYTVQIVVTVVVIATANGAARGRCPTWS